MPIRVAQYGVKHGHAAGKARALLTNPAVDFAGIYEPDAALLPRLQADGHYAGAKWFSSVADMLNDPTITAVAIEGSNAESLAMAAEAIAAGKHLWYDKPAGDDWPAFQRLMADAAGRGLAVQMGYMFRYHAGFQRIGQWVRSGLLGDVFSIRAHMSTWLPVTTEGYTTTGRGDVATHHGGIFYDLAGHMLDQVVWLLGRPQRVTAFLHNDANPDLAALRDNTLGVFEFDHALAVVEIAAMEARPTARRFEVYGTGGSAIMEPLEPAPQLRLHLQAASPEFDAPLSDRDPSVFPAGSTTVAVPEQSRQRLYDLELAAFVEVLEGRQAPDRTPDHELLVQETLLRATRGGISR